MSSMARRVIVIVVGFTVGALLTGCGDDDPSDTTLTTVAVEPADVDRCPAAVGTGDGRAPAMVQGVEGMAGAGSGEASIRWLPVPDEDLTCYEVHRALSASAPFELAAVIPVRGTSIILYEDPERPYVSFSNGYFSMTEVREQVEGGSEVDCCFHYQVVALDGSGNRSEPSAIVCAPEPALVNGCD